MCLCHTISTKGCAASASYSTGSRGHFYSARAYVIERCFAACARRPKIVRRRQQRDVRKGLPAGIPTNTPAREPAETAPTSTGAEQTAESLPSTASPVLLAAVVGIVNIGAAARTPLRSLLQIHLQHSDR